MSMQGKSPRWSKPMTYTMLVVVASLAIVTPLVPEPIRPWNFAIFGALGLFAAGRVGLWQGLVVCLGCKFGSDVVNYFANQQNSQYLPMPEFLICFAVYPLIGRLLRRTDNPMAVATCAVVSSLCFFLVSNFAAWCQPKHLYGYKNVDLLTCFEMGLPFLRFSIMSDLLFSVGVFAVHSMLAYSYFPVERAIPITVDDNGANR